MKRCTHPNPKDSGYSADGRLRTQPNRVQFPGIFLRCFREGQSIQLPAPTQAIRPDLWLEY